MRLNTYIEERNVKMKKTAYLLVPSALFLLILSACGTSSEAESEQAPAEEVNVAEETAADDTETQKEEKAQEESETAVSNEEETNTAASAEETPSTENDESGENESSADNSSTENAAEETAPETEASVSENGEADQASENTVEEETNAAEEEGNAMEEADGVTETVTLYFSDDQLMETLTEERSVTADTKENLPAAALEAWIAGPESEGMFSPVNTDTTVQYVESDGSQAVVSFSSDFAESNVGSSGDAAIMEQIASIMSQFGYSSTQLLIEGEINPSIFGHVDTSSPIKAGQ